MIPHYSKHAADTFCKQARSYSLKREGRVVSSIYSLWEALHVSFIITSARYFMLFHPHNNCVMGEIALFYKWSVGSLEEPRNWLHITLQGEEGAGMRPKNLLISQPTGSPLSFFLRQRWLPLFRTSEKPSSACFYSAFRSLPLSPKSVALLYRHTFLTTAKEDGDDSSSSRSPDVRPDDARVFPKVKLDSLSKDWGD